MERRRFLWQGSMVAAGFFADFSLFKPSAQDKGLQAAPLQDRTHQLPVTDGHYLRTCSYIEDQPAGNYSWASEQAYENFQDLKFGIRVHWGLYSILQLEGESWPFLAMSKEERQSYQELYLKWDPQGFNAEEWMQFFADSGARMFSFTTKHHDGFSMFDTRTKVKQRVNWSHPETPVIEDCDLSYSIMETPFKRDVVKELMQAASKHQIKADLYFSHPDWYDADFRPYTFHPVQVPGADKLSITGREGKPLLEDPVKRFGRSGIFTSPAANADTIVRMMKRHRDQLEELITNYGDVSMVCLDMFLGPAVWPQLRDTIMYLRSIRPDIMFRARGIGNYGDYYTPEGFVPGNKEKTDVPWFVIYPLGKSFSFEPDAAKYKGTKWIIHNLVDAVAKGGSFMAGIGPDGEGRFHFEAIRQLKETGEWLRINGEAIYHTRARDNDNWKEGELIRFTRSKDNKTVYAFCLQWPEEVLTLSTIQLKPGSKVFLLGNDRPLPWKWNKDRGTEIFLSAGLKGKLPGITHLCYTLKLQAAT